MHTKKRKYISKGAAKTTRKQHLSNELKADTSKVINMYLNLSKFRNFYKNLTSRERIVIDNYKRWGYQNINRFLYSGYKPDTLIFPDYMGFFQDDQRKTIPSFLKKYMNYNDKKFINEPEFITVFMNKLIINRIYEIDNLFTKPEVPKLVSSHILYRGTSGCIITNENSKIGDDLIFKNYTSASLCKYVALNFTDLKTKPNNNCSLFILHNLENLPYIYLPWFDVYKNKDIMDSPISSAEDDECEYLLPRNLKFKIIDITIGMPIDNTKSYAHKTFKQINHTIEKYQSKYINNKLTPADYNQLSTELFKNIKIFHLKFVEKLEIGTFPKYVFNNDIKIINNSK